MRGLGIIAASFSSNSIGSKQIARVPSCQVRRSRSTIFPSAVRWSLSWGQRRSQHIAAQMFQPLPIPRRHGNGSVQIETFDVAVE